MIEIAEKEKENMIKEVMPLLKWMAKNNTKNFPHDEWEDLYGEFLERANYLFKYWKPENGKWKPFVQTCISNYIVNKLKRENSTKRLLPMAKVVSLDAMLENSASTIHDIIGTDDRALQSVLDRDEVEWTLGNIPYDDVMVAMVNRNDGMTYNEIAEMLNVPVVSLYKRVNDVKEFMRDKYMHHTSVSKGEV